MKSGKGNANNRSGTTGVNKGKGKRKKFVNTNVNTSSSTSNKSSQKDRTSDKHNGLSNNNSSGRWVNGDDSKLAKNYKHKSISKGKKGRLGNECDDDRPFESNSIPSTTHSSYNNTSRKGKVNEESKDKRRRRYNSSQNYRSNDD